MDLKGIAEAYQSIQEAKENPGLQAYLDKKKGKKDNGDEKEEENGKESKGSKPDFLDLDKDGDKKEPMKKAAKEKKMKEEAVIEHHQKDADGKVIEHDDTDTTPSSVEEDKTVLSKLTENGEELDMFDAVVAYLIYEGFAKTLEEAQKIMPTLKSELVEEVYQNQLWTLFDENYRAMRNPEKYKDPDESDKPYRERSKAARMRDPHRGINSPAFKKFMADRGM